MWGRWVRLSCSKRIHLKKFGFPILVHISSWRQKVALRETEMMDIRVYRFFGGYTFGVGIRRETKRKLRISVESPKLKHTHEFIL